VYQASRGIICGFLWDIEKRLDKKLWGGKLMNVEGKTGSEKLSWKRSFGWFDGIDAFVYEVISAGLE